MPRTPAIEERHGRGVREKEVQRGEGEFSIILGIQYDQYGQHSSAALSACQLRSSVTRGKTYPVKIALITTKIMSRVCLLSFQNSQANMYIQMIAFVGLIAHATAA